MQLHLLQGYLIRKSKDEFWKYSSYKRREVLVGDWNYLGTINPISGDEDYNGAGSILSILNDRTFSDEGTTGHWEVGYDNDKHKFSDK